MRYARLLCLLLAIGLPAVSLAGDIQVTCEPGLRVYLDNELVGTSTANEDGLYLTGVPEGPHTVRVEKPGFLPQGFQVEVAKLPIQVKVGTFTPVLEGFMPKQEKTEPTKVIGLVGDLTITSAPQNCTVSIDGKSEPKDVPVLSVGGLPAGKHTIAFSRKDHEPLSTVIEMQPGAKVTVQGDFIHGTVDVQYDGKGSLRLYSWPQSCGVQLMGHTYHKTDPVMNVSYVPAGEHQLVVEWAYEKMSTNILITDRHRTIVKVDFRKDGVPFVVTYEPL